MPKYILGSGLIGLLCREILGPEWKIIPFARSRYYTFDIPLADNFITHHKVLSDLSLFKECQIMPFKRGLSIAGELIFNNTPMAIEPWSTKLGLDPTEAQLDTLKPTFFVYNTTCGVLYNSLMIRHQHAIAEGMILGSVERITDHQIITDKTVLEYDKIISTIPLGTLITFLGYTPQLESKDVYFYLVHSSNLDLEACDQVLVCDTPIDFFKVNAIVPNTYMFFSLKALNEQYIHAFVQDPTILGKTFMRDVVPVGEAPDAMELCSKADITPIGSHAQHDYFMDVSSCIKRITKLR